MIYRLLIVNYNNCKYRDFNLNREYFRNRKIKNRPFNPKSENKKEDLTS